MGRYSPSSSPSSSPVLGPVDSSPPGSPGQDYLSLDADGPESTPRASSSSAGALMHPFSGAAKATRAPPAYERRTESTPPLRSVGPSAIGIQRGGTASPTRYRNIQPPPDQAFVARMFESGQARSLDAGQAPASHGRPRPPLERELFAPERRLSDHERWYRVVCDAIDRKGQPSDTRTVIDVSGSTFTGPLQIIAPCVSDLQDIFVCSPDPDQFSMTSALPIIPVPMTDRPLLRTHTAPASALEPSALSTAPLARAATTISLASPAPDSLRVLRHEVHVNVANNEIALLPPELFVVENLTVLNLRNNQLTYIPPAIVKLRNLSELNLSTNRLPFLPAELLDMTHISTLIVTNNPFILPPASIPPLKATPSHLPGLLPAAPVPVPASETQPTSASTPTLTELAMRTLLAPYPQPVAALPGVASASASAKASVAATRDVAPLRAAVVLHGQLDKLPPLLLDIFRVCAPEAVVPAPTIALTAVIPAASRAALAAPPPGQRAPFAYGECSNPDHATPHPFFQHAEERITWETCPGAGRVPFLWRGCTPGCLAFLAPSAQ